MLDFVNINEPFWRHEALAAGVSRRELASGAYRKICRGIYVSTGAVEDGRIGGQAALLVAGHAAFLSHHEAARLYGAVVPSNEMLHASVPLDCHRSRRKEIAIHKSSRTPLVFRGLPVTSPEDTFLDLAMSLSLVDLVVLGDSLVRMKRTAPEKLLIACSATPSSTRAKRAAELVRAGVDSAMETRTRLLMVLAGLPEPETNICFYNQFGELIRRTEMGYRAPRLAIEYEGRQHAESQAQWESDIVRREEFDGADWRIISLIAKDVYRTPAKTLDRIVKAMNKAGLPARVTSDEWRRHFPGY